MNDKDFDALNEDVKALFEGDYLNEVRDFVLDGFDEAHKVHESIASKEDLNDKDHGVLISYLGRVLQHSNELSRIIQPLLGLLIDMSLKEGSDGVSGDELHVFVWSALKCAIFNDVALCFPHMSSDEALKMHEKARDRSVKDLAELGGHKFRGWKEEIKQLSYSRIK